MSGKHLVAVLLLACITVGLAQPTTADYGGVGIKFTKQISGEHLVDYALGGSPAARAGILPKDMLVRVNGVPVRPLKAEEVAELIRGPVGSKVTLTCRRALSESLDFVLTRAQIEFPDRLFRVRGARGYGFIDPKGNLFIPLVYAFAGNFREGLAPVTLNGRCGYIDRTGFSREGLKFNAASELADGYGRVELNKESWFVGRDGRLAFRAGGKDTLVRGRAWRFSEGRALFTVGEWKKTRYGFIDTTGSPVIATSFSWADDFSEGLAPARELSSGRIGYIDRAGKWAIQPRFTEGAKFSCGRAFVREGDKTGFVDRTGRMVIDMSQWSSVQMFHEGLLVVVKDDKSGYMDTTGRVAIKLQYDEAGSFSDGRAWVRVGEKHGYIDQQGKVAVELRAGYEEVGDYLDGMVLVKYEGKYQCMDRTGKEVWREE